LKAFLKNIIKYLSEKWLFLLIVILLIMGNVWIWDKVFFPPYPIWNCIKVNIEIINGFLLTLATIAIVGFAWRQYRLEKTKRDFELYNQRASIYFSAKLVIEQLLKSTALTEDTLIDYKKKIVIAPYLFNNDSELIDTLNRLPKNITPLENIKSSIQNIHKRGIRPEDFINKLYEGRTNIEDIYKGLEKIIDQKFEKYLRIE